MRTHVVRDSRAPLQMPTHDRTGARPYRRFGMPAEPPNRGDHHPGWRVTPGPDGRGIPPPKTPAPRVITWRVVVLILALLGLNVWIVARIPAKPERVRVPYSPFFLQQVRNGNVESISSKGATVQGEFRPRCAIRRATNAKADEALRHRGADVRRSQAALRSCSQAEGCRRQRASLRARDARCSRTCC